MASCRFCTQSCPEDWCSECDEVLIASTMLGEDCQPSPLTRLYKRLNTCFVLEIAHAWNSTLFVWCVIVYSYVFLKQHSWFNKDLATIVLLYLPSPDRDSPGGEELCFVGHFTTLLKEKYCSVSNVPSFYFQSRSSYTCDVQYYMSV